MTESKIQIQIDKYGNESSKAPVREFDDRTGEFEYADPEIRKKAMLEKNISARPMNWNIVSRG
ncbi:MAG: hypothetical protein J6S80_02690 [Alphaproteobacteria bacterium]|nr:hypothetical protein [Alphaproteobacteria bacterium]